MKNLTRTLLLTLTVLASTASVATTTSAASGDVRKASLDSETQDLVVSRLEDLISEMRPTDPSWKPSNIRLADVLAERARTRFMTEVEANCKGCKGSGADRTKALKIYSSVVHSTSGEQKGIILFQMAALHELANNTQSAVQLYQTILKARTGSYSQKVITRTQISLADLYFQMGKSKEAKALYTSALKDPNAPQRGISAYRLAWCDYNLSQFQSAIQGLETLAGNKGYDEPGILPDVLRDLISFYAQDSISNVRISKFMTLVPVENKKEMTLFFAQEAGRLGQKPAATTLYKMYLQDKSLTKEENLNASLALVQTSYDQGQSKEAVDSFEVTAASYQKNCKDKEKCADLQKQMRKFVTELNKLKISKPDQDLLRAYEIYARTFPSDVQMGILGAQIATDLKQPGKANQFYAVAADQAPDVKMREMALLGEIEGAEGTGNKELREKAYNHYLKLMPNGPKSYEVRYQLAQVSYERKDWKKASAQFTDLALEKTSQKDLQKKSADLALDSLAVEKRDAEIESLAQTFAQKLPQHATEFRAIYRKAVNAQIVQVANNAKASNGDLNSAIQKNKSMSLAGASDKERIMHYNNLAVLAKRASNDEVLLAAYASLLSVPTLSAAERESTLASQVGYFEKKLDFKSAYTYAVKMKFPSMKTAERELRLGTLADLAGLKPQTHYARALKAGLNKNAELSVRNRLVLLAANPAKELKAQMPKMMSNPKLVADTTLLIYAKNRSSQLNFAVNNSRLQNQPSIQYIKKQYFYPQQSRLDQKIASHKLDLKNDARMAKSIQARLKLLGQADKSLAEAVQLRDFTAQIMALSTIERENMRLNQELLATPAPKGLTPKELARYAAILKKSANPYALKARYAQSKVQSLWNQKTNWQNLLRDYTRAQVSVQELIGQELKILANYAPNSQIKDLIEDTLDQSAGTRRDLLSARDSVSEDPNNVNQIEKLINLETKLGHPLMTTYLEQRLGQIQKTRNL